ncbi:MULTISPECIES: STAS domain-containing protein [Francisella]|uniref:STAS domain-containing protein n=1 Tax=Francisella TaxID=262 RepID=UPI0011B834D4|nr:MULTISPECIES: STAS domain-containing protein [Francisella]
MIAINNNKWIIESELTLKTVSQLYKTYKKDLTKLDIIWIIDFSPCTKIDSSGLSLIIEYIKYAKRNSIQLKLENIDQKTFSLAKVHGADTILEEYLI